VQPWQKLETSAFTSQSETSPIGTYTFLWCLFRVKRIASNFSFRFGGVELAKVEGT
jgi:hypothetical protein